MDEVRDETLAARAADGDMRAFEELVNRNRKSVYRLARSITGCHADADEASQETFLRVYRSLGSYDPSRPFAAWLRRIAYNASLNAARAASGRAKRFPADQAPEAADPAPDPLQTMEGAATADRIGSAVRGMPAELRATLLLRAVEGMSYGDIAAATGVRIGTVMSRLSRARERILAVIESVGAIPGRGERT